MRKPTMPVAIVYVMVIAMPLAVLPFALIAYYRAVPSSQPRVHIFQGMDNQPKLKPQAYNAMFADNRAMRPPIPGTVARGELAVDDHYEHGKIMVDDEWQWADTYPGQITVDEAFIERGRERFNIYCATCHGQAGYGDGMTHKRALELQTNTWVQPTSLHNAEIRDKRPLGQLYHTIRWGVRTMPGYGAQIPTEDRWAIVAYIKALQLSQHAPVDAIPPERRQSLR
jgi:mono/diheme cytochrome c family protein